MTNQHLDLAKVMECYGGSPLVLIKTMRRIHTTLPDEWRLFLNHCDSGDFNQASIVSHRMAGTLSMAGADEFSNLLREISRAAKSQQAVPSDLLARAMRCYDEVLAEIATFVARFPIEARPE